MRRRLLFPVHSRRRLVTGLLVVGLINLTVLVYGSVMCPRWFPPGYGTSDRSRIRALFQPLQSRRVWTRPDGSCGIYVVPAKATKSAAIVVYWKHGARERPVTAYVCIARTG